MPVRVLSSIPYGLLSLGALNRVILTALLLLLAACGQQDLSVTDAYVRAPIPGKNVTAGFMTIHNKGSNAISLNGVSSTSTERIEMHEHRHDNGTMRMRQVDGIAIAPGEHTVLEPGGYHLMIFGLDSKMKEGDNIELQLSFSDGSTHPVSASLKSLLKE